MQLSVSKLKERVEVKKSGVKSKQPATDKQRTNAGSWGHPLRISNFVLRTS